MIGVVMGSKSDWGCMSLAVRILNHFGIPNEYRIVSAHRTPDLLYEYAKTARSRGLKAIIAGAGGAAHLPGMVAALTPVPVIGVPIAGSSNLVGLDSLLSIVQMPQGVPVATVGINNSKNAALLAMAMWAVWDADVAKKYDQFRAEQTQETIDDKLNPLIAFFFKSKSAEDV
jgi:phosphoribosylaminoimidazole carboxylase PurE protein